MIAVDTNVLVRYLVEDDPEQAQAARTLLYSLSSELPGFVCREVIVELVWVPEQALCTPSTTPLGGWTRLSWCRASRQVSRNE